MLLKDCQKGYPIFILNRNEITATQGKIIDVSRPHFDNRNPSNTTMVIDVTVDIDGKQTSFVMPESSTVAYTDNLVLSCDRADILHEVEAICSRNEEELKQTELRKQTVSKCKSIIEDWNPAVKQQRETDERMTKMEQAMGQMRTDVNGKFDLIMQKLGITPQPSQPQFTPHP